MMLRAAVTSTSLAPGVPRLALHVDDTSRKNDGVGTLSCVKP
jgi:hypothetical protein